MFISEINIYPIKSLGGVSVQSSLVENRGLQFDRRWMLVNAKNNFLTQREFPLMATIKVEIQVHSLKVSSNNESIEIPLESNQGESAVVKVWGSRCRADVYEKTVNKWFSDCLQTDCKLVRMPETTQRKVNYFYAVHDSDTVSFADGYPLLLIGEGSLEDLNSRLEIPVPMDRFRPNIVVSGTSAFEEDGWKQIVIGKITFHLVKACGRCVLITVDQKSGKKQGIEPLKTLADYRIPKRSVKKKILFGQLLIAENIGGKISVGDRIEVVAVKNKPKFV